MYIKNFLDWIKVKVHTDKLDTENNSIENSTNTSKLKISKEVIRKGEIRWSIFGVNIGREMDGKGENFARPVLILHVIGDSLALVAPITSKNKKLPGYIQLDWSGHGDSLCIHQIRIVSTKRILKRLAKISDSKLKEIKNSIKVFYNF